MHVRVCVCVWGGGGGWEEGDVSIYCSMFDLKVLHVSKITGRKNYSLSLSLICRLPTILLHVFLEQCKRNRNLVHGTGY